MLTADQ